MKVFPFSNKQVREYGSQHSPFWSVNRDSSIKDSKFVNRFRRKNTRSKFKSMLANYIIYTTVYQIRLDT